MATNNTTVDYKKHREEVEALSPEERKDWEGRNAVWQAWVARCSAAEGLKLPSMTT